MFHVLHRFWRWLLARLGYCGGAHFLAGAPSLPPPLTPEQEFEIVNVITEHSQIEILCLVDQDMNRKRSCWLVWLQAMPLPGTT